mgnify:CR=1 FL=1
MTYTFDDNLINEIRETNDIVDIISQYIDLKRTGSNYKGLCPFHNEKTPSFVVSPDKQIFHCFGCGEGGDIISFLMKYRNISFIEAIKELAERSNITLPEDDDYNEEKYREKNELFKLNRDAALYFYKNLQSNKRALKYLKKREINIKTIKRFGLGYSNTDWEDLLNFLKKKGYKEDIIYKAGLIIQRKNKTGYFDRFRDRIIFPIINSRNKVIGFGGRVLDNSQPKYMNSPDTPVFNKGYNLYGINILKNSSIDRVLLVEGYMDVISLNKYGINYAVASLGTALTNKQAKLLKRYSKDIYICYDSDKAGLRAAEKALDVLYNEGINARVVLLSKGKDPDDFIKEKGKKEFEKALDNSLNFVDYKIYLNKNKVNLNTAEGKIEFTKNIAKFLRKIKSSIELDVYINEISGSTGISAEAIKKEVEGKTINTSKRPYKDKYINKKYRDNIKDRIMPVKSSLEPGHLISERNLLNLIIKDIDNFNKIKDILRPEDFINETHRELAKILYRFYQENKNIEIDEIIKDIPEEHKDKIEDIFNLNIEIENTDKALEDYINKINYYKNKLKREEIKEYIKEFGQKKEKSKGEVEKFKALCGELIEIDKLLKINH